MDARKTEKRSTLTLVLFTIYLVALIWIILFKLPFYSEKAARIREINWIPLLGSFSDKGVLRWQEILGNILVFIPLGIYLPMMKRGWSFVQRALPIVGLTVAFEVLQFIFAIGRSDVTDILANALGGLTGIGIHALLFRILGDRTEKAVNALALAVLVCALLALAVFFFITRQARIR
jgi:glycopeptide antibiotics resistance protein